MRRQHLLILRRQDHKRDALGAVFLGAVTDEREIRSYVERYLGHAVSVREIHGDSERLRVSVESSGFVAESQNLARLGRSLAESGRSRSAMATFEEALKLDPLNVEAWKGQAALLAQQNDLLAAEESWVRAGEIGGYDGTILRGLATLALRGERRPTAIAYLEEALLANGEDVEAREMLDELRRQTELQFALADDRRRGPSPKS